MHASADPAPCAHPRNEMAHNLVRAVMDAVRRTARVARTILGAPDYARYCEHRHAHHPGEPMLSADEFNRAQQTARYSRPGARCC